MSHGGRPGTTGHRPTAGPARPVGGVAAAGPGRGDTHPPPDPDRACTQHERPRRCAGRRHRGAPVRRRGGHPATPLVPPGGRPRLVARDVDRAGVPQPARGPRVPRRADPGQRARPPHPRGDRAGRVVPAAGRSAAARGGATRRPAHVSAAEARRADPRPADGICGLRRVACPRPRLPQPPALRSQPDPAVHGAVRRRGVAPPDRRAVLLLAWDHHRAGDRGRERAGAVGGRRRAHGLPERGAGGGWRAQGSRLGRRVDRRLPVSACSAAHWPPRSASARSPAG